MNIRNLCVFIILKLKKELYSINFMKELRQLQKHNHKGRVWIFTDRNAYTSITCLRLNRGWQTNIEVKIEDDTVWLTQQQLTKLYQCSKSNISEYIKHIFKEGELVKDSVVRKFRTTADEGKNIMLLITIWIWLSFLYIVLNQWLQQDSGSGQQSG